MADSNLLPPLVGSHSLGTHLNVLLRDAEQKVRELQMAEHQQHQQSAVMGQPGGGGLSAAGAPFNSRASFTSIIGNNNKNNDNPKSNRFIVVLEIIAFPFNYCNA